jgi:hypothetical protein
MAEVKKLKAPLLKKSGCCQRRSPFLKKDGRTLKKAVE